MTFAHVAHGSAIILVGPQPPRRHRTAWLHSGAMDLHVIGPLASPAERAAVDAVLGPGRVGAGAAATRNPMDRRPRRPRRPRGALATRPADPGPPRGPVADRLDQPAGAELRLRRLTVPPAEAYGVATFYALFATTAAAADRRPRLRRHRLPPRRGGGALRRPRADARAGRRAVRRRRATWLRSPCLGLCERAPAAMITIAGAEPRTRVAGAGRRGRRRRRRIGATRDATGIAASRTSPRRRRASRRPASPASGSSPASASSTRRRSTTTAPTAASGPSSGPARSGREQVIDEVTASGLVGRGGAAFPTGRKWAAVAGQPAQPHYLVCNADESEPGTFKDRVLMEGDPFAVVEAMAIEAFAVGADEGVPLHPRRVPARRGPDRERDRSDRATAGLLGDLDIELRRGAGAYICGEETALFESIEGKRGEPRNKPPFPVEVGLFGKPTAVNNVETLVNVLLIVGEDGGAEAFKAIGTEGSTGPKLFCVSGNVARPGVYEVEFGATLARAARAGRRRPRRPRAQGRAARRRGRRLRRARTRSTRR